MANAGELSENVRKKLLLLADKKYYSVVMTLNEILSRGETPNIAQLIGEFKKKYGAEYDVTDRALYANVKSLIDGGIIKAEPVTEKYGKYGEKSLELDSELQDALLTVNQQTIDELIGTLSILSTTEDKIIIGLGILTSVSSLITFMSLWFDGIYFRELVAVTLCLLSSFFTSMLMVLIKVRHEIPGIPSGKFVNFIKNLSK